MALLYHMAVQRMCKNPLEEDDVVGITNYIDLGLQAWTLAFLAESYDYEVWHLQNSADLWNLQVATNLEAGSSPASSSQGVQNVEQESHLRVGAAWQVSYHCCLDNRRDSVQTVESFHCCRPTVRQRRVISQ